MSQGNRKAQYLVTFAVCLGAVATGVCLSWTTPVLPKLRDQETSMNTTKEQISWIAATGSPGFMTGSLVSRFVSDRFGRRAAILGSALPVILGTILVVVTSNVWLLYIIRFLWGIGVGMFVTISTIYLAEISDKEIRGALSVSSRFMFNFGNFLVMAVGPFVMYNTLNYMLLALPIAYFFVCWFIPETPYYSLKAGKVDQARKTLKMLRNYTDEKELENELTLMGQDVKKETLRSGSLKELITGKQYRKAVVICAGIKIAQTLSGSIVIQHYLGLIVKDSKIQMELSTAFIIFGAVRFVSAVMSSLLADRLGRRPLLIYSFVGTALSLGLAAAYFCCLEVLRLDEQKLAPYGIIAFVGIVLSVILSTLGFNSLIYLLPAELFPLNVKTVAMTSLNIFGGLSNFTIIKVYQQFTDWIGLFGVFTIFAAVALAGGLFSFLIVPETKGKSLREILVLLQGTAYDETAENLNKATTEVDVNGSGEATELRPVSQDAQSSQ
ncbi:facilitated trehalose transporter Tret1-like [Ostrinia furnacalis]|uniref:facilitated trehalose transporter Tret1-like n=1 Tax=Ostrinia furnacalis TaxID=93504 RepID=UPI00103E5842|nr:facilitated trehalose transporter Tret1-like [Ostrinia furnacalis]